MIAAVQERLLRFLRVPPEPDPPLGAPGSMRVFQAAPSYFRYQLVTWGLGQAGALWGLVVGVTFLRYVPDLPWTGWIWVAEGIGIASYVIQLPLTLLGVALDFRMRWYIVTDRSLRVREGLMRVREQTMGFANIQNLSVRQGPLQRLLGIADLEVRTAGGGDGGSGGKGHQHNKNQSLHLAYFRGVDNAEEIKTLILERLRRLRGAGLGDPDEGEEAEPATAIASAPAPAAASALTAARELAEEARRLRQAVA